MSKLINRKGVAGNALLAAGFGLAMAFTLSSCSADDVPEIPVQCPAGSSWNGTACASSPVGGACPPGTTIDIGENNMAICVWQQVDPNGGTSAGGDVTTPSSSGTTETTPSSSSGTTTNSMWETFNDERDGGTSTISMTENANGSITVSGTVASTTGSWGVGWGTYDDAKVAALKAAAVKSISFKVTGDGQTYRLQLPTNDIENYDYYVAKFETISNTEKTVKLCLSDFRQDGWSGVEAGFSQSQISGIEFLASGDVARGTPFGPVTISDLSFGTDVCIPTDRPTINVGAWGFKAEGDEGTDKTSTPSTISITESAGIITATGTIRKGTTSDENYGYAMIVAWPDTETENTKLKTANSISFTAKGDGKTYFVEMPMSNITDGANYRKTFTAGSAGNTVTICFKDLAQPTGWGERVAFDASKLTGANWQAHTENNITGDFSFTISSVSVGNNASCNDGTGTVTGTTVKPGWWYGYDDSNDGGTSEMDTVTNTNGSFTISGKVVRYLAENGYDNGFIGFGTNDPAVLSMFETATSVSFKVKGDGKTYRINLETTDVTDFNWYHAEITTINNAEEIFEIDMSEFVQENWGQTQFPPINKNAIKAVNFMADQKNFVGNFGPVTVSDIIFK